MTLSALRQVSAVIRLLKFRAGWQSMRFAAYGAGALGFFGDFFQPYFEGKDPFTGPLAWIFLLVFPASLAVTAVFWHSCKQSQSARRVRYSARFVLLGWTSTSVVLVVIAVNFLMNEPRGIAASIFTPVGKIQAELFEKELREIGYDVAAIKQSVKRQEETLSQVADTMNLSVALAIIDRAKAAKDGSHQGQVRAIENLLARGHEYSSSDLSGISFAGANLTNGVFAKAKLHAVDLSRVIASRADLSGSGMRFARLEHGNFSEAKISGSYAPFVSGQSGNFQRTNLSRSNFFGSNFRGADFRHANLQHAAFTFADLRDAKFDGADLTGTLLIGSLLDGASFAGALFSDTDVKGTSLDLSHLSAAQRKSVCQHSNEASVRWRVDLIKKWPSNKYSTGYEFERLRTRHRYFQVFSQNKLARCRTAPDRAVGYHAGYPGSASLHLDRAYLNKGNREKQFLERVDKQSDLIAQALSNRGGN